MSRKNAYNYFEALAKMSQHSYEAAQSLHKILRSYNTRQLPQHVQSMHIIEHAADTVRHFMTKQLAKEFLPPLDREDILYLSQKIDDVTDSIEDVLLYIHMINLDSIRVEMIKMSTLIEQCCESMFKACVELKNFKTSKDLAAIIIEINKLEEEGDKIFYGAIRNFTKSLKDSYELYLRIEVINRLERCLNNCEEVADLIELVIIKNT
ncbi:DUF47 family protein [Mobilitalea sibirica]|uniref:DUF47 family protein n=1 Tax=Mobilitalea sibirica TaxID=1462919 RepID=A0A8J7KZE7_9FIRM|nr:DUF47 family protein [Mobilitalea sibirica]MBH1940053.1 DUF47 family protein [Mobilitalea sibirica]